MMPPKSEEIWMVVIKQGGTAEAALNATNGMIDSKTKTWYYFVAHWYKV
jgi:hypothetical protein